MPFPVLSYESVGACRLTLSPLSTSRGRAPSETVHVA